MPKCSGDTVITLGHGGDLVLAMCYVVGLPFSLNLAMTEE